MGNMWWLICYTGTGGRQWVWADGGGCVVVDIWVFVLRRQQTVRSASSAGCRLARASLQLRRQRTVCSASSAIRASSADRQLARDSLQLRRQHNRRFYVSP